jgi:hypothetical protein
MKFQCTTTYDNETFIYGMPVDKDNQYDVKSFVNCFEADSRLIYERNQLANWLAGCAIGSEFKARNSLIKRIE